VTTGDNCTIGAGPVVTHDIPDSVVSANDVLAAFSGETFLGIANVKECSMFPRDFFLIFRQNENLFAYMRFFL